MAYSVSAYLAILFSLVACNLCHSFNNRKLVNEQQYGGSTDTSTTQGTWYGDPNGFGSDGGACGYQKAVGTAPFSSMITAIAPSLYNSGRGCGTCYMVKCTSPANLCSGKEVLVVATDECPGCEDNGKNHKFDLSGTAYGAMAITGHGDLLRNVGQTEIEYRIVECNFGSKKVAFMVDTGSNPNYFSVQVEYIDGFQISKVEISNDSTTWIAMTDLWGARYKAELPNGLTPPYSIKLYEGSKSIVAANVIPLHYILGETYTSFVNFPL